MKTLIVDILDDNRLGELVTVSKTFCEKPDLLVIGEGQVKGSYDKVYYTSETVEANLLSPLTGLIEKNGYEVILFSATTTGGTLAGPLATRISAVFLSEVTGVGSDLVIERPIYGGKALAKYKVEKLPAVLTVRRKYFEKDPLEGTTEAELLPVEDTGITLISEREEKMEGIPLEDAEVIVSGGRGIGAKDSFVLITEMADLLKGAVGASRGAVDEGWVPPQKQIGQTGKIVAPTVYFAVGVSGASQHLAGITNAKCVVAINKDEEANIFNRAQFGIAEDYKKVVPALIEAIKAEG